MYVNAKMIPVETVPGIRAGEMKDSSGGGEFKHDNLKHNKNLYKCCNVPHPAQQ
jgi:hypothetical protein